MPGRKLLSLFLIAVLACLALVEVVSGIVNAGSKYAGDALDEFLSDWLD